MTNAESIIRKRALVGAVKGGMSVKDAADKFELSINTVRIYCSIAKVSIGPRGNPRPARGVCKEREIAMHEAFQSGQTLQKIGDLYGISCERVRQLITKYFGDNKKSGGIFVKTSAKRFATYRDKTSKYDAPFQALTGLDKATYCELTGEQKAMVSRGPAMQYRDHKRNAEQRGIPFAMTFPEWWKVWKESGFYPLRGRVGSTCYVMARIGDTGGYSVGNVMICTKGQNAHDQYFSGKTRKKAITVHVKPREFGPSYIPDEALRVAA